MHENNPAKIFTKMSIAEVSINIPSPIFRKNNQANKDGFAIMTIKCKIKY